MDSFLVDLSSYISVNPIDISVILAILLAVFLLSLSAFASASEIAFFSLSPTDIESLDPDKNTSDKLIQQFRDDSERTLATILITNNLVNVAIIMLCNYIFSSLFTFKEEWLQFLCVTILLTFLLLLFGEIVPKVYSRRNPLAFCRSGVKGIVFFRKLFWPIETILLKSGAFAEKVVQKENRQLSVDDLEQALELTDKNDIKDEQGMLQGIIRFGDETAKEVMTSRQDIIDLDIRCSYEDVLKCIVDNNYSRIPVYQDNQDNIRGVLYIKDLLPHLSKPTNFRWQSLIRPPYFVPETKKIDDLLRDFQENKVHIAIVVDEFGGTSGIVTLEDILEEIVGEINDEFDEEERNYTKLGSNIYIFEGKTLLKDFSKILNLPDDEFDEIEGDAAYEEKIFELAAALDSYIPTPERAVDKPFLLPIEDVFSISGRGTVVTGRVERGIIHVGDEIEIVGLKETQKTTCTGVEMFRKLLDEGQAGDNVGVLLRGTKREDVERGQVLAKPGTITPHTKFKAEVYVLSKEEGGRHTPFFANYRPQFYFRTTDVTGAVTLEEGVEMVMPGENVTITVELIAPIAMEEGLRFAIREGGRTVGAGVVSSVIA